MGSSGVMVATVPSRHEADLVKAHLEAAGLTAWLVDEGIVGANPFLAVAVGGVKVHVPAEQEAQALALLESIDEEQPDGSGCLSCGAPMAEDQDRCPACGWTFL
jgi:hypothetical protein